jgi:hypothetical protein
LGWSMLGRGSWHRDGQVVVRNVCASGFDMRVGSQPGGPDFTFRWRPPLRNRVACALLPTTSRLLARAVLVQYPAMWWAATRGRAPLHAPALAWDDACAIVSGSSGIGKTTLVLRETSAGAWATGDNLSVADGRYVWGVTEPVRSEHGSGRRMPHGRREGTLPNRAPSLRPDRVVIIRRDVAAGVRSCAPEDAARGLITSTYMAGELRRYWGFASLLAIGTGIGPAHPPVTEVASTFARSLQCLEVGVPDDQGSTLSTLIRGGEVAARTSP